MLLRAGMDIRDDELGCDLEAHLINSEESHMFFKMKQKFCQKGPSTTSKCVDKEQCKIK